MSPSERRTAILDALCARRHDTTANLAAEFGVSERTIRNDILELTRSYPIKTVRGRYGGGVEVEDWYRPNRGRTLNPKQADLLKRVGAHLKGEDLATLNSIIAQFAPY